MEITPQLQRSAYCTLAHRSFEFFCREAWGQIDPTPLLWGQHLTEICKHLQAVEDGTIRRLVVNIPPGHAKSMLISVLYPAWLWLRKPSWRLMTASYDLKLAMRDAVKSRALFDGIWFQELLQDCSALGLSQTFEMSDDQNLKSYYANSANGFRMVTSVSAGMVGHRGDILLIDDPLASNDAHSKLAREEVIAWKTQTMSSRFNDLATAREVLVMQRLHEDDLTGYLLSQGGWEHLCLPSEFEPERAFKTSISKDWRTQPGELLFPEKFPQAVLDEAKSGRGMGSLAYAGQHQQRPAPAKGGIIQREWLKTYEQLPGLPDQERWAMVVDCAFKGNEDSDLVAVQVWLRSRGKIYLVDTAWKRMGFIDTVQAILGLRQKYPGIGPVYIEDKANGSAIIEVLKTKIPGIIPVQPNGGKEARVHSITPYLEAGNVMLPKHAPFTEKLVEECMSFPRGANDDGVDAMTYAIDKLLVSGGASNYAALASALLF